MKSAQENPAPIRVTRGRPGDVEALYRLYSPEKAVSDIAGLHTRERFRALVRSREDLLLVARRGKAVAGALDAEFYPESGFSYFANLVVAKNERRKGVAGLLLDEYERFCRKKGIRSIVTLVYDWNKSMRRLMERRKYGNKGMLVEYVRKLK